MQVPVSGFYRSSHGLSRSDHSAVCAGDENSFYWRPGVSLPTTSTPSHLPCGPPVRQLCMDDLHDDEPQEDSVQDTLKAILSSQTQFQKQITELLNRVDTLEKTIKDSSTSLSSASDDHEGKKRRRLPSELCVSTIVRTLL